MNSPDNAKASRAKESGPPVLRPISYVYRSPDPAIPTTLVETIFDPERALRNEEASGEPCGALALAVSRPGTIHDHVLLGPYELRPQGDTHNLISHGHVLLPSGLTEYQSEDELDNEIRAVIRHYCDVPDFWLELMLTYVKMTWLYDLFTALPYLRFLGEWQSGKTRMAEVVAHLCYKVAMTGGATTSAPIFRLLERFQGTLFVDEADFRDSNLWSDIIKILNTGYRRNGCVLRCDGDNEVQAFRTYGPKILTTRKRFDDPALESRCLTLETRERIIRDDIPSQLGDGFYAQAKVLRNKLLLFRFRNYSTIETDEAKLRLKGVGNRNRETSIPLLAVSRDPAFGKSLKEFLKERHEEERAERPQAMIVAALAALAGERLKSQSCPYIVLMVKDVAQQASLLKQMQEPEAVTTAHIRPTGEEPSYFTAKKAGYLLRILGLETRRINTGYEFELTASKLHELEGRYPIGPEASNPQNRLVPKVGGRWMGGA